MVNNTKKILLIGMLMGGTAFADNAKEAPAVPEENPQDVMVKGIDAIKTIQQDLELNKKLVKAMEQAVSDAEKKDAQLRSIVKEFNELFPGEGTIWERMERLEDREKALRELEEFRKKHSYVISKAIVTSAFTGVIAYVAGYLFIDKIKKLISTK